jgi:hypothetical protein
MVDPYSGVSEKLKPYKVSPFRLREILPFLFQRRRFTIIHNLFVTSSHLLLILIIVIPIEKEEQGMKKLLVVALMVVFGALLSTAAVAAGPRGQGPVPDNQVDVNAFRAFQKETLPLRDEMAAKRLELRNEFNKDTPDQAKIATLQKEMIDLRTKISAAAKKNGLPDRGFGPGYGGGDGYGPGYGRGYHMGQGGGYGPGYGRGSCPMWQ